MVVVTSPIGDHAPPAFAAIITNDAKYNRSSCEATNLRIIVIITIVVVKLSKMADKKKAKREIMTNKEYFEVAFIRSERILNPWCKSMSSTIVIAPIKNNNISAILLKLCESPFSNEVPPSRGRSEMAIILQHTTPAIRAGTDLSNFNGCSNIIKI